VSTPSRTPTELCSANLGFADCRRIMHPESSTQAARFRVLVLVDDEPSRQVAAMVLPGTGCEVVFATTPAEAISVMGDVLPDVALVHVAMGAGAGLALVHHLRALRPDLVVHALARPEELQLAAQALSLGGAGLLLLPLAGDELLSAVADLRARAAERDMRRALQDAAEQARSATTWARSAYAVVAAGSRRRAAEALAQLWREMGAERIIIYLPAGAGLRQLTLSIALGEGQEPPGYCEELEALRFAELHGLGVARLAPDSAAAGLLLAGDWRGPSPPNWVREMVAHQAGAALSVLEEREQQRGALKDATSSAYTFAYFVDVAGREIDRARRHHRRFALATLELDVPEQEVDTVSGRAIESVLATVRDTDVLARVDRTEFFLLMPETDGIGAQRCRRRVLEGLPAAPNSAPIRAVMGVATYPHDGTDLSHLLRVASHRADSSRKSVTVLQPLDGLDLPSLVSALLARPPGSRDLADLGRVESISLPLGRLGEHVALVVELALRGGPVRLTVTDGPRARLGHVLRSALGSDRVGAQIDVVEPPSTLGADELVALTLVSQCATYVLIGYARGVTFEGVHSADALLLDRVLLRLAEYPTRRAD
jgi:PleD family two-component response regulator